MTGALVMGVRKQSMLAIKKTKCVVGLDSGYLEQDEGLSCTQIHHHASFIGLNSFCDWFMDVALLKL